MLACTVDHEHSNTPKLIVWLDGGLAKMRRKVGEAKYNPLADLKAMMNK